MYAWLGMQRRDHAAGSCVAAVAERLMRVESPEMRLSLRFMLISRMVVTRCPEMMGAKGK